MGRLISGGLPPLVFLVRPVFRRDCGVFFVCVLVVDYTRPLCGCVPARDARERGDGVPSLANIEQCGKCVSRCR